MMPRTECPTCHTAFGVRKVVIKGAHELTSDDTFTFFEIEDGDWIVEVPDDLNTEEVEEFIRDKMYAEELAARSED